MVTVGRATNRRVTVLLSASARALPKSVTTMSSFGMRCYGLSLFVAALSMSATATALPSALYTKVADLVGMLQRPSPPQYPDSYEVKIARRDLRWIVRCNGNSATSASPCVPLHFLCRLHIHLRSRMNANTCQTVSCELSVQIELSGSNKLTKMFSEYYRPAVCQYVCGAMRCPGESGWTHMTA